METERGGVNDQGQEGEESITRDQKGSMTRVKKGRISGQAQEGEESMTRNRHRKGRGL